MTRKTIALDPKYLTAASKSSKSGRGRRQRATTRRNTGLRGKLISRIKEHQKSSRAVASELRPEGQSAGQPGKGIAQPHAGSDAAEGESELDQSIAYLEGLSAGRRSRNKRRGRGQAQAPQSGQAQAPQSGQAQAAPSGQAQAAPSGQAQAAPSGQAQAAPVKVAPAQQPAYSCLKNGSRPTYRTLKNRPLPAPRPLVISDRPTPAPTIRGSLLQEARESAARPAAAPPPPVSLVSFDDSAKTASGAPSSASVPPATLPPRPKPQRTRHLLGKRGRSVGVLIADTGTRRKRREGLRALRRTEISKVKNYLRDRQLLRDGSAAPGDVLRTTYEQAVLAGDISNTTDGALAHNYLSSKEKSKA